MWPALVCSAHSNVTSLEELFVEGCKKGFVPYRINIKQQAVLPADDIFWKTTNLLKQAIDPNGILAPNRYNPIETNPHSI